MNFQARLKKFIEAKGLNYKSFEAACGFGNGTAKRFNENSKPRTINSITATFPELNPAWLLTGQGPMLNEPLESNARPVTDAPRRVPLYSLEAVAGFDRSGEDQQYIEDYIDWYGAKSGDVAIHIVGNSMSPRIPQGAIVLARPYDYTDYRDLEFGKPHIVVTTEDKALLKVIRLDRSQPAHLLLESYNPDYPQRSIPVADVRRVFLAVSVLSPL